MSKDGKMNTEDLVKKIDKLTKERISKEKVVSLSEYRKLKQKDLTQYNLLIIDDDETIRTAMKRMFQEDGYSVITAADGTQLAQVLDDSPLDLIILDVGLPWINGYELAKLMKENDDLKNIPLIFISGRTGDLDVKRGFDVGADDYIKKPFDVDNVKKTVKTLLKINHG
ncbi:MAG: response regulator [Bdellovibrionaceae bacterium]|nr:response regulator [Pseudobdellovibrionaceae bacterium]|tara:strand:- start:121 stop:627 length:507 start_codon:yes stop_codon:yes gene_type:complete